MESMQKEELEKREQVSQSLGGLAREIKWDDLIYSLDFIQIKLLNEFYSERSSAWVLPKLRMRMRSMNISYSTLIRRLRQLDELGLIKLMEKTKPLAMRPVIGLESNVKMLIKMSCERMGFRMDK